MWGGDGHQKNEVTRQPKGCASAWSCPALWRRLAHSQGSATMAAGCGAHEHREEPERVSPELGLR